MTKASLLECAVAFYSEGWSIEHIGRPVDFYYDYKSEFLSCIRFLAEAENAFFFIVSI